jgi:hypothetical protein
MTRAEQARESKNKRAEAKGLAGVVEAALKEKWNIAEAGFLRSGMSIDTQWEKPGEFASGLGGVYSRHERVAFAQVRIWYTPDADKPDNRYVDMSTIGVYLRLSPSRGARPEMYCGDVAIVVSHDHNRPRKGWRKSFNVGRGGEVDKRVNSALTKLLEYLKQGADNIARLCNKHDVQRSQKQILYDNFGIEPYSLAVKLWPRVSAGGNGWRLVYTGAKGTMTAYVVMSLNGIRLERVEGAILPGDVLKAIIALMLKNRH